MKRIGITTYYAVCYDNKKTHTCERINIRVDIKQYDYIEVNDPTDLREIADKVREIWNTYEQDYDQLMVYSLSDFTVHYDVDDTKNQDYCLVISRRSRNYDLSLYIGTRFDHTDVIHWKEPVYNTTEGDLL